MHAHEKSKPQAKEPANDDIQIHLHTGWSLKQHNLERYRLGKQRELETMFLT